MFELHPILARDTVEVARLTLCRVLLMNDAAYPWLILVPEHEGLRDLHDLSPADQAQAMAEVSQASEVLKSLYAPYKLNVAALGNVVEQLHIHVIARFRDDAAWPAPVWGAQPPKPYDSHDLQATAERLKAAFSA